MKVDKPVFKVDMTKLLESLAKKSHKVELLMPSDEQMATMANKLTKQIDKKVLEKYLNEK